MATILEIRKGDKFSITQPLTDDAGTPLVLDVADLVAQVYTPAGELIEELTVTAGATSGDYVLETSEPTSDWPALVELNIKDTVNEASSAVTQIRMLPERSRVIPAVTP